MQIIDRILDDSKVHSSWRPLLARSLQSVDEAYLHGLWSAADWLPGCGNMLAAFRCELGGLRYILFGESPYPRPESNIGIAFLDGAVDGLWSAQGLSKPVNRATSLRNLMKCMLVADGMLDGADTSQPQIAAVDKSGLVDTIFDLFNNLAAEGFLMLNATPVLHESRKPLQESRYWLEFNRLLLEGIADLRQEKPTLVLWGKIAKTIRAYDVSSAFRIIETEHPYNVSFINNADSLALFSSVSPLKRR